MVLAASIIFALAFLFAPKYGVVAKVWKHNQRRATVQKENTLKSIFHLIEKGKFKTNTFTISELEIERSESNQQIKHLINKLVRLSFVKKSLVKKTTESAARTKGPNNSNLTTIAYTLTDTGWVKACEIVRNHRLWELFLVEYADIAASHVDRDADLVEHVLGAELVVELERTLGQSKAVPTSPHPLSGGAAT